MADYYTRFSTSIPYRTQQERLWLLAQLGEQGQDQDENDWYCDYEDDHDKKTIWVHSEESGNPHALANLIARFQTRFDISTPWTIGWANTCSRPRIDAFDGGALAVYKGKICVASPHKLINQWIARQQRKEQKTKLAPPENSSALSPTQHS